jgi:hypothetical protein
MSSLYRDLQAAVGPGFEIGRELPGAGMSRVFLAREPALARDVVVKVLPPDLVSTTSLQRFTREIQVTAGLQHPHILPVLTAGGNDQLRYYITPFIRGESLRTRLAADEPMTFAECARVAEDLLTAIAFAHARGVVHRDVKPGNILLSEGHAILADFGIASIARAEQPVDHNDQVTGSTLDSGWIYVAPEQPRGESRDLFAAAVVIHEMVTGVPGIAGATPTKISAALRARHPAAPAGDVRKLSAVLSRALAVDPAGRYASASALRGAIGSIGSGSRRPWLAASALGGVTVLSLSFLALNDAPSTVEPPPSTAPMIIQLADTVGPAQQGLEVRNGEVDGQSALTEATPPAPTPPMAAVDSAALLIRMGLLHQATALYQAAAAADPNDSRAQLGVATTVGMNNSPADIEAARIAAEKALVGVPELDAHDRAIAEGYVAMGQRRFPDACDAFDRASQARGSFVANFGAGDCRLRDDAVVFDAAGAPMFRSSFAQAAAAFMRAIRAASPTPPVIAYRRLTSVLPQNSAEIRVGRTADGRIFAGSWRIVGDSLTFALSQAGVPRPIAVETFAEAATAADRARDQLRPLLLAWIKQSPNESAAHEMLAILLENSGLIAQVADDRVSALGAIERARAVERDTSRQLSLALTHTRLLLRGRRYAHFASLTDTLLATPARPNEEVFIPLALMTGRVRRATDLVAKLSGMSNRTVRGADGRPVDVPAPLVAERADFLVRATLGICDSRVQSAPKRMVDLLDAAFPGGIPRGVESDFLQRIVQFALPCLGTSATASLREPSRSLQAYMRAWDPNDTAFPEEFAAQLRARPQRPVGPEQGVDGVIVEALVKVAIKDSIGALRSLTLSLDRIPMMGRGILMSEWTVGSIPRGMALAAELAAALGDRETAQRWASAVVTLWRNADPELQPQVERLREILKATSPDAPPPE